MGWHSKSLTPCKLGGFMKIARLAVVVFPSAFPKRAF